MSEQSPLSRLNCTGDLASVIDRICDTYGIGKADSFSVITTGYEDCNVIIETEQGRYLAKMFAKFRTAEEINRYVEIIQHVIAAGVHHPELLRTTDGHSTYSDSGITLSLLSFVEGKTFYDRGRIPNNDECKEITEQATKINNIDYRPSYLFDSWAIPNIQAMFDKVQQFIQPDDLRLVERVMQQYKAIPVDELPHAFVHGDIIKTNTLKGDDGKVYIIDFSVANWYPRIQELAVIAANLLHDDSSSLKEACEQIADEYSQFNPLTTEERRHLYDYALAGVTMEFMGAHQEKYLNGNATEENEYWLALGRKGLRKELV